MAENSLTKNHQVWLEPSEWWQGLRLLAIWVGFGVSLGLSFLAILTLLDWLWLLQGNSNHQALIVLATLLTLFTVPYLRRWSNNVVDFLLFPDVAIFKEEIEQARQTLIGINSRAELETFLTGRLPHRLKVDFIVLAIRFEEQQPTPAKALTLTLEMGGRFLGNLFVGPKCSGRSFDREELAALNQLREQVSLVLSVIYLQEARDAAERASRLQNNFLTNISHQLRTPLNSVINLTGLVADEMTDPANKDLADYLHEAVSGSEYLLKLLDDILDITRLETGQLRLQLEPLSMAQIIETVLPLAQGMLKEKPVSLKVDMSDDLPPVIADRLRVHQILLNLLSNAAKFTETGSITITVRPNRHKMVVSIADTGPGIAKKEIALIFEDYHQILQGDKYSHRRRRHLGTGLGMPITKALVELHGGRISVNSQPGHGAIFTFTLSLATEPITDDIRPTEAIRS